MRKWKIVSVTIPILLIALFGLWAGGRPIRYSLASNSSIGLTRWHFNQEDLKQYGEFVNIGFDVPEGYRVQIDRQEDFATYRLLRPSGEQLVMLYFGNHPDWPPKTRWIDWRGKSSIGDMSIDVVSHWSLFTVSKEVWICRSPRGWGVHGCYTHLSKRDAALADKIIGSIQPPVSPGG